MINDIFDVQSDLVNKPQKMVVHKLISKKSATFLYAAICTMGAATSWYLATYVNNQKLFLIYPVAVVLLYFYSRSFKKLPLTGNIAVSIFCAGVAGVVLFAERKTYTQLHIDEPVLANNITGIFAGYIVFAFLSTLLREVVKDMEDMEGDRLVGLRTFPIVFGINKSKSLSIFIAGSIFMGLSFSSYWLVENSKFIALIFLIIGIMAPLIYLLKSINKSAVKTDYSRLSKLTKMIMLAGLVLLVIIWKF